MVYLSVPWLSCRAPLEIMTVLISCHSFMKHHIDWYNVKMSMIYPAPGLSALPGRAMLEHNTMLIVASYKLLSLFHEPTKFDAFLNRKVGKTYCVTTGHHQEPSFHERPK